MTDALTLRRTSPDGGDSFATLYEHPEFGKIDVGRIGRRLGNPTGSDAWSWSIGIVALPGLSHTAQGTAATMKAAQFAWKAHWPKFRDARSEAEWHDAKEAQDNSEKKLMILDARKIAGLTSEQQAELTAEMGRPGPAPHWLRKLVRVSCR
jgi:hypothetical protein